MQNMIQGFARKKSEATYPRDSIPFPLNGVSNDHQIVENVRKDVGQNTLVKMLQYFDKVFFSNSYFSVGTDLTIPIGFSINISKHLETNTIKTKLFLFWASES